MHSLAVDRRVVCAACSCSGPSSYVVWDGPTAAGIDREEGVQVVVWDQAGQGEGPGEGGEGEGEGAAESAVDSGRCASVIAERVVVVFQRVVEPHCACAAGRGGRGEWCSAGRGGAAESDDACSGQDVAADTHADTATDDVSLGSAWKCAVGTDDDGRGRSGGV